MVLWLYNIGLRPNTWARRDAYMELKLYLRLHINNKILPLFKETKCSKCGSENQLHLHHDDFFIDLLEKTMQELNLRIQDTSEYTTMQLNQIRWIVLGKHLDVKYKTFCKICHLNFHKYVAMVNSQRAKQLREEGQRIAMNATSEYILANVGKRLYKDDQKKLISIMNIRRDGKSLKSISILNDELEKWSYDYMIKSCRDNRRLINRKPNVFRNKTYWIIVNSND